MLAGQQRRKRQHLGQDDQQEQQGGSSAQAGQHQLSSGDALEPIVTCCMGDRLGNHPLLQIAHLAVRALRLLLDGRQQQGLQVRMLLLDGSRNGPIVRLQAAGPVDDPACRQNGRNAQGQRRPKSIPSPTAMRPLTMAGPDETADQPADRQPPGQVQAPSPVGYGLELSAKSFLDHVCSS